MDRQFARRSLPDDHRELKITLQTFTDDDRATKQTLRPMFTSNKKKLIKVTSINASSSRTPSTGKKLTRKLSLTTKTQHSAQLSIHETKNRLRASSHQLYARCTNQQADIVRLVEREVKLYEEIQRQETICRNLEHLEKLRREDLRRRMKRSSKHFKELIENNRQKNQLLDELEMQLSQLQTQNMVRNQLAL